MWEPLCEPWSFNTSVQLQDQTWMISSENKETLNINVSAPFVETMLAITDSIKLDMTTFVILITPFSSSSLLRIGGGAD